MILILLGCAVALLFLAFFMGDTSLGGPSMVIQIVLALGGVGCVAASVIVGIVRLFA